MIYFSRKKADLTNYEEIRAPKSLLLEVYYSEKNNIRISEIGLILNINYTLWANISRKKIPY